LKSDHLKYWSCQRSSYGQFIKTEELNRLQGFQEQQKLQAEKLKKDAELLIYKNKLKII